jgi:hypothetical protein
MVSKSLKDKSESFRASYSLLKTTGVEPIQLLTISSKTAFLLLIASLRKTIPDPSQKKALVHTASPCQGPARIFYTSIT